MVESINYPSYRHQLFQQTLKKYYNDTQPPGDVVMNSIQLNTLDSNAKLPIGMAIGNRLLEVDYYGFPNDLYNPVKSSKKTNNFSPLEHFLIKGKKLLNSQEKSVETKHESEISLEPSMSGNESNKSNMGSHHSHTSSINQKRKYLDAVARHAPKTTLINSVLIDQKDNCLPKSTPPPVKTDRSLSANRPKTTGTLQKNLSQTASKKDLASRRSQSSIIEREIIDNKNCKFQDVIDNKKKNFRNI